MMSTKPIKTVLLVQSNAEEARVISEMFNDQGSYSFSLTRVECLAEAEAFLKAQPVSVVLLDLSGCPDATGDDAISRAHAAGRDASIVLLIDIEDHAWR